MHKKIIEYTIPIQSEEHCEETNKNTQADLKSTDWHIDNLFELFLDTINVCGEKGGWYIGDSIRVKIEIEYQPEDK